MFCFHSYRLQVLSFSRTVVCDRLICSSAVLRIRNHWLFHNKKALLVSFTIVSVLFSANTIHYSPVILPMTSLFYEGDAYPRILGSTSHVEVAASVSFLVVEGVVENVLSVNVRANVTASFYDANNNSIGFLTHATDLELIKPGKRSPFTIYWPTNYTGATYVLGLSWEQTSEQPVDILDFRDVLNQTDDLHFIIRGRVWNGRPLKALLVSVACIYYNDEGNFSGLARAFVPSVDAGGSAEFNITVDSSVEIRSYDLVAYAGGYEERSLVNYVLFAILVLLFLCFVILMKRRGW